MSADILLERLEKVRKTAGDKWQARCPAHDDKGPSLSIRELDDGRVLLHCHAQCGAAEVLDAVGLDFSALFPPKITGQSLAKVRRPFNAHDALNCLSYDLLLAVQIVNLARAGEVLADATQEALVRIAGHLLAAQGACNGR